MSTKKIKLKRKQLDFLVLHIKNENLKMRLMSSQSVCDIIFSNEEIETILDELTYLLTSEGFDINGNINESGILTEDIIDVFSNQLYNV